MKTTCAENVYLFYINVYLFYKIFIGRSNLKGFVDKILLKSDLKGYAEKGTLMKCV